MFMVWNWRNKSSVYKMRIFLWKVELWRWDIRKTLFQYRTFFLFIIFFLCVFDFLSHSSFWERLPADITYPLVFSGNCMRTPQFSTMASGLAQPLELSSSTELGRINPSLTREWESPRRPSLSFLHGDITQVCIPGGSVMAFSPWGIIQAGRGLRRPPTPCPELVQLWGQPRLLRAWSVGGLKPSEYGDGTASRDNLLMGGSFPVTPRLNLSRFNLWPLSLALLPCSTVWNLGLSSQMAPLRHQKAVIRSYPEPN